MLASAVAVLVRWSSSSVVAVHRLNCFMACEIFQPPGIPEYLFGLLMSCWTLQSIISPNACQGWRALEITEHLTLVELTSSSTLELEGWENGNIQSKFMLTRIQETQDCSAKGFCQCLPQMWYTYKYRDGPDHTGNGLQAAMLQSLLHPDGTWRTTSSQLNTNFEDLQNECACVQVSLRFRNFPLVTKTSL